MENPINFDERGNPISVTVGDREIRSSFEGIHPLYPIHPEPPIGQIAEVRSIAERIANDKELQAGIKAIHDDMHNRVVPALLRGESVSRPVRNQIAAQSPLKIARRPL